MITILFFACFIIFTLFFAGVCSVIIYLVKNSFYPAFVKTKYIDILNR